MRFNPASSSRLFTEQIAIAGDVGKSEVLDGLRRIAPVVGVRGNVDHGHWAHGLRERETVEIGEIRLLVLHNANDLAADSTTGFAAVISGHSHKPSVVRRNGVLFLNPGSAGPRRFKLPVSVALLRVIGRTVDAQVMDLINSSKG